MKTQIWVVMRNTMFNEPTVVDIVYSEDGAKQLEQLYSRSDNTYVYEGPFEIEIPDIVTINNNTGPINIRM